MPFVHVRLAHMNCHPSRQRLIAILHSLALLRGVKNGLPQLGSRERECLFNVARVSPLEHIVRPLNRLNDDQGTVSYADGAGW